MNPLTLLGIFLLILFTLLGIWAYIREKRAWKEIEKKASRSGIDVFDQ